MGAHPGGRAGAPRQRTHLTPRQLQVPGMPAHAAAPPPASAAGAGAPAGAAGLGGPRVWVHVGGGQRQRRRLHLPGPQHAHQPVAPSRQDRGRQGRRAGPGVCAAGAWAAAGGGRRRRRRAHPRGPAQPRYRPRGLDPAQQASGEEGGRGAANAAGRTTRVRHHGGPASAPRPRRPSGWGAAVARGAAHAPLPAAATPPLTGPRAATAGLRQRPLLLPVLAALLVGPAAPAGGVQRPGRRRVVL